MSPPSVVQVRDLLAAAFDEEPAFGVYLWLLATTGCRRGEGCALRWKDVSWSTGELLIRRSIAHVGRDIVEKSTKIGVGQLGRDRRRLRDRLLVL